jgi:hypothetical protein
LDVFGLSRQYYVQWICGFGRIAIDLEQDAGNRIEGWFWRAGGKVNRTNQVPAMSDIQPSRAVSDAGGFWPTGTQEATAARIAVFTARGFSVIIE